MPPDGYWQGKVALVTGASQGLGLELARALVEAGARVALLARQAAALDAAAQSIGAPPDRALLLPADVTDDAQLHRAFQRLRHHFDRLDCLINCAGRSARGRALETTPEQFRQLLEVNFLGAVHATRLAAPLLAASRGHLVNIGSLAGKSAARWLGAYPASKFALSAYTQQLRLELADEGIHVLLVCPGPIARAEPRRYEEAGLPAEAQRPGGGVRTRAIDPADLARRILKACQRRRPELVVPWRARLLFAVSQLSPRLGDYLVTRMTRGGG